MAPIGNNSRLRSLPPMANRCKSTCARKMTSFLDRASFLPSRPDREGNLHTHPFTLNWDGCGNALAALETVKTLAKTWLRANGNPIRALTSRYR